MAYTPEDLSKLLDELERETRTTLAKIGTARKMLAGLELPSPPRGAVCPRCDVEVRGKTLDEHLADVHGERVMETAEAALTRM